jgi:hypothetical protein
MRNKLVVGVVTAVAVFLSLLSVRGLSGRTADAAVNAKPKPSPTPTTSTAWDLNSYGPDPTRDDVVLQWNQQILDTIIGNPAGTGPTITARALGEVHTSMYDAWAAYDPVAKRTQSTGMPRQMGSAVTLANKSKAISFAAYTSLVDLFPYRSAVYADKMVQLGYDLGDTSTPAVIGRKAAEANIAFRHGDYSNQSPGPNGTTVYPYACPPAPGATCYSPVNQWNNLVDKWRWQPLCVLTPAGVAAGLTSPTPPDGNCVGPNYTVQQPLTPQWGYMKPFALTSAALANIPGPPTNPDGSYSTADIEQAYADTSNLTDAAKSKAEYWADGPKSVFPPGHDMIFAQALSRKRGFSLDTNVKLFFTLGNAMLDSSIAAWKEKYIYDFVRPITAIRWYYAGQTITSWLPGKPPGQEFGLVPAEQWLPYQALNVVTPPFPEYVSGHSTFSGAGQQVLMAFTGSDAFNAFVVVPAGSSKIEAGVPTAPVTLTWSTFTAAADEAGMSRRYGGIHFSSGDYHGRMLGKAVGSNTWSKAQAYFQGYTGYSS